MNWLRKLLSKLNPFGHSGPDMADHFPASIRAMCERADDLGRRWCQGYIKREPSRISGWTVTIVQGERGPHGIAIKCGNSPTGWARASTTACHTKCLPDVNQSELNHEARHVWAYMNKVPQRVIDPWLTFCLLVLVGAALTGCESLPKPTSGGTDWWIAALSNGVGAVTGGAPEVLSGTKPDGGCACDLSRPVLNDAGPIQAITQANPHGEECGLQEREGKQIRPIVSAGGRILTVSSIYAGGKIKDGGDSWIIPCPVSAHGYSWHATGYHPSSDHVADQIKFAAGERRVPKSFCFLFVEGRP